MSRLAKKFLRPDSVDGTKIKLSNDEALRAVNAQGNGSVSFLKVNSSDKPEFLILPVLGMEPTESTQAARKGYVDTKAEAEAASALSSANSYTDSAISSLINGAPALLDTLKELADALGGDENFAVTISNQLTDLDARLDVIEGSDTTEGSVLWAKKSSFDYTDAKVAQEVIDRDAAISVAQTFLQGEIDQEISDRETAVGLVQTELDDTQVGAGLGVDGSYSPHATSNYLTSDRFSQLNIEPSLHGADKVLDTFLGLAVEDFDQRINLEESQRTAADTALSDRLDVLEADPVTKSYVDGEVLDLQGQIDALDSGSAAGLAQEILNREAGDNALDARLDIIEGDSSTVGSIAKSLADSQAYTDSAISNLVNGAPALLDTLKELSDALGGDENFAVTIAGQISGLDTRLDTLEGADTVSGSLLWGIKQAKDYTDAEIAQEVIDRDAAILVETNNRVSADDALDARLDIIEGVGEGSISKAEQDAKDYADGIVDTEEAARIAADDLLDGRLDVIEGDASTVGSIAKAQADAQSYADGIVASEQSARELADDGLQDQLDTHDAEITDLQAQVESLNSGTFNKVKKVLSSGDITAQYVDLAHEAKAYSTMVFVQGGAGGYMHEGDDYTVSVVGGVTRISFMGDFATGGSTALDTTDVLYVQYQYVP